MIISPKAIKEKLPNPVEIVKDLDEYIIGQRKAKKVLSILMLNRGILALQKYGILDSSVEIEKTNVLLLGPTGCGKTGLIRALSKTMDLPISIFDVSGITSAGYVGGKVEDILTNHILEHTKAAVYKKEEIYKKHLEYLFCKQDDLALEMAQNGVIYLDEIDKLRSVYEGTSSGSTKDFYVEKVQNELLKIFEGEEIDLTRHRSSLYNSESPIPNKTINTKNISFICGGAFKGLDEIIMRRLNRNSGIGFQSDIKLSNNEEQRSQLMDYVTTEDLVEYGFKPELLGRIPLRASLSPITREVMLDIITKPKNSILSQYVETFKVFGIDLVLDDDAKDSIVDMAMDMKVGARSLKAIFSNIMLDHMFDIYSICEETLVITKDLVDKVDIK